MRSAEGSTTVSTGHESNITVDDGKSANFASRNGTIKNGSLIEENKFGPSDSADQMRSHPNFQLRERRKIADPKKDGNYVYYGRVKDFDENEEDEENNSDD